MKRSFMKCSNCYDRTSLTNHHLLTQQDCLKNQWVKPRLVYEVAFAELTDAGEMGQTRLGSIREPMGGANVCSTFKTPGLSSSTGEDGILRLPSRSPPEPTSALSCPDSFVLSRPSFSSPCACWLTSAVSLWPAYLFGGAKKARTPPCRRPKCC